ncbi:MAG TPA: hypothetical protein VKS60_03635 [Stellaceae bacterium]|nr:hypothetical protein [Stellaceae bacterium]
MTFREQLPVLRPSIAISLVLVSLLGVARPASPRTIEPANLPFTLSWTQSICRNCKTASTLSDVRYVAADEAWAIGYTPPGETGTGDYSILHTRDGGNTWAEIPSSYQHNIPPKLSFLSRREGWIMIADIVAAEQRLLETSDGGEHWRRLPLRDLFVRGIQYFGAGAGLAYSFNAATNRESLLSTTDHWLHWNETPLPEGFAAGRMAFDSVRHGVLAGCLQHGIAVFRTSDAGQHWEQAQIDVPPNAGATEHCEYEVDDLSLDDGRIGWLMTSKHSFPLGDISGGAIIAKTTDGGATWAPAFQTTFRMAEKSFTGVRFIDDEIGFITQLEESDGQEGSTETGGAILYTTDGGRNWRKMGLPAGVWGCRPYAGSLTCAAGGGGFSVLTIRRADSPP